MTDPRREILNQVAAGTITAEEGAARLQALEAPGPAPATPERPAPPGTPVRRVAVISRFGNAEVIGDPNVAYAVAEGPHQAHQDGDTMVIEQTPLSDDTAFEFVRPYARIRIPGFDFHRQLTVRMNPSLALRTKVQAGSLRIQGVTGAVTTDVQAGNCLVEGFAGPIALSVAAGNVDASGRLDGGESSIRCRMGEVNVELDKSSNVRINAHTTMGEVAIEGVTDSIVGSGAGILDVGCTMGNVRVRVG
jgi:hypothetical protein